MVCQMGTTFVLCTCVFTNLLALASAFDWVTEVETAHACLHGEASFPWRYDEAVHDVSMVYWRFGRTGDTVIARHLTPKEQTLTYFDTYTRRASLMDDANAGIILKNVTLEDEGRYNVELSGVLDGLGSTELQVHTNDELKATIQIDGTDIEDGDTVEKYQDDPITLVVSTSQGIPALINIHIPGAPGSDVTFCDKLPSCTRRFNLTSDMNDVVRTRFIVNYGFCDIKRYTFHIKKVVQTPTAQTTEVVIPSSGKSKQSSSTSAAVAIILVVLLLVFGILLSCFCIRRRKINKAKLYPAEEKCIGLTLGCCPIQEDVPVDTEETKFKLVSIHHKDQLRSIERNSRRPTIIIESKPDKTGFIVRVPRKDYFCKKTQVHIQRAQGDLDSVLKRIEIHSTSVSTTLLSTQGREFLDQRELQHKVLCSAESQMETPVIPPEHFEPGREPIRLSVGGVVLEVINGDVTKQRVDAVIAVGNPNGEPHALVSKVILDGAGDAVTKHCKDFGEGSDNWQVTVLDGGNLRCPHLIYVNMEAGGSRREWDSVLALALECAKQNQFKSVALPAFGAGPRSTNYAKVIAGAVYKALRAFSSDPGSTEWVRVVIKESPEVHKMFAVTIADLMAQGHALNKLTVVVEQGDITESTSDVIVNGTNPDFGRQGAVTQAIERKGKGGVTKGWKKWKDEYGKLKTVALTDKGDLPGCKAIINLNTVDEQRDWPTRIYDVLVLAENEKQNFSGVAFPAFGTGKLAKIDTDKIAPWMYKGIRKFADNYPDSSVREVKIIAFEDRAREDFSKSISQTHIGMPYLKGVDQDMPAPMRPPSPVETARVTVHTLPPQSSSVDDVISDIQGYSGASSENNHMGPAEVQNRRHDNHLQGARDGNLDLPRAADPDGSREEEDREDSRKDASPPEEVPLLGKPLWSYEDVSDGFQPFSLDVSERLETAYVSGERAFSWIEGVGSITVSFNEPMTRRDELGTLAAVRREVVR